MTLAFSPYELKARTLLGHSTSAVRSGALLRVEHEDLGVGYADCHPWPELGDEPLERQLALLSAGRTTALTSRSLALSRIDAEFRARRKSAFSDLSPIPESHLLLGNALDLTDADLDRAAACGFRLIKIKAGRAPDQEARILRVLTKGARNRNLRIRIDLNERLTLSDAFSFFDALCSGGGTDTIDFIEDPVSATEVGWQELKERFPIRLARDRGGMRKPVPSEADIFVLKPALQDPELVFESIAQTNKSLVITTYLDHPLGSAAAAWYASLAGRLLEKRLEPCGLMSHLNYEETPFSRGLARTGPFWTAPSGTGFGFDEELAQLDWRSLA